MTLPGPWRVSLEPRGACVSLRKGSTARIAAIAVAVLVALPSDAEAEDSPVADSSPHPPARKPPARDPPAAAAPTPPSPPASPPRLHRYAWGDNKWTGLAGTMISSGVTMAGGAGLAVLTEPRLGNEIESRVLHIVGLGIFTLSALPVVVSPISTLLGPTKKPNAPLAPTPFLVGSGAMFVGGGAVAIGMLATLGDEGDSPWDDGRGVAIASGAVLAAFGVSLVLIGAADSGVANRRYPWSRMPKFQAASLELGPGSASVTGRF